MSDDDEIILSPDCPERDSVFVPLRPSYKVSEVDSLVVFDTWCEKTPAIASCIRGSDGRLAFVRTYPMAEDIPQQFWEIWYPSICARITAKVRRYFQFCTGSCSLWYFVGINTQTLYVVIQKEERVMTYEEYSGIETGKDVKRIGVSDGLSSSGFCKINESYGFKLDALQGTDYLKRKLDTPEDIMSLAYDNANVERILRKLLTEDEWGLL